LRRRSSSRRGSQADKNGDTESTGYETDREDNVHNVIKRDTLDVPDSELIFESDEFDEPSSTGKEEKVKVRFDTESDDERSFVEEEMAKSVNFPK